MGFSIKSRQTYSQKIDVYFNESNAEIKEIVKNIDNVCTTADIWTTKHKGYLGKIHIIFLLIT